MIGSKLRGHCRQTIHNEPPKRCDDREVIRFQFSAFILQKLSLVRLPAATERFVESNQIGCQNGLALGELAFRRIERALR